MKPEAWKHQCRPDSAPASPPLGRTARRGGGQVDAWQGRGHRPLSWLVGATVEVGKEGAVRLARPQPLAPHRCPAAPGGEQARGRVPQGPLLQGVAV